MTEQNSPEDIVDSLVENAAGSRKTTRRRRRRGLPLWWNVIATAIFIGCAVLIYHYFTSRGDAPIPANVGAEYVGIDQGFTEQGFARLGSADAPVLVEEFASYACPHCRDFHLERFPAMLDEIAAGQVQFVMIPVPNIGSGAKEAAEAALCAGQQGQYWEMNDVLFDWQKRFVTFTFDKRRLHNGAQNLGLDVSAFDQCMGSKDTGALVETALTEFRRRGLSGTPTFFINGEQVRDYSEFDNLAQLAESLKP
jgi:protein-disulfide isomerase